MPKRRQSPDASRRNFLKGAGLVGAAAAAEAAGTGSGRASRWETGMVGPLCVVTFVDFTCQ